MATCIGERKRIAHARKGIPAILTWPAAFPKGSAKTCIMIRGKIGGVNGKRLGARNLRALAGLSLR
jgi:hypothetical protein